MELPMSTVDSALREYSRQTESLIVQYIAQMEARLRALESSALTATILHRDALAVSARIRERADAESQKYRLDPKGRLALRSAMRKAFLTRYGIKDVHDLPMSKLDEARGYIDAMPIYRAVMKIREKARSE